MGSLLRKARTLIETSLGRGCTLTPTLLSLVLPTKEVKMFEVTVWDGYDEHTVFTHPMLTVAAEVAEQERRKGKLVALYDTTTGEYVDITA